MPAKVRGQLLINNRGVFLLAGPVRPPTKISERIDVRSLVTVEGSTVKFLDIGFIDCTGQFVSIQMSPSEFADFRTFKSTLLDHGYTFPTRPELVKELHTVLLAQKPRTNRHMLQRHGWHEKNYVFADEPIRAGDRILCFTPIHPDHARNFGYGGDLLAWKEGVGKYARYSTRLTLSIALAFEAALLNFCDVESGGVHLAGESGIGKTVCLLGRVDGIG